MIPAGISRIWPTKIRASRASSSVFTPTSGHLSWPLQIHSLHRPHQLQVLYCTEQPLYSILVLLKLCRQPLAADSFSLTTRFMRWISTCLANSPSLQIYWYCGGKKARTSYSFTHTKPLKTAYYIGKLPDSQTWRRHYWQNQDYPIQSPH